MYWSQLLKFVALAGWIWVGRVNLVQAKPIGLIAQGSSAGSCTVGSVTGGQMSSSGIPPTSLTGTFNITVNCGGNVSGKNLQLVFNPSPIYNGIVTIGTFAPNTTGTINFGTQSRSGNTITIPISWNGNNRSGSGTVQVTVVAPNNKLLKAAANYTVTLNASIP
jgi:hypothetical protein